jgi:hypothetical protein
MAGEPRTPPGTDASRGRAQPKVPALRVSARRFHTKVVDTLRGNWASWRFCQPRRARSRPSSPVRRGTVQNFSNSGLRWQVQCGEACPLTRRDPGQAQMEPGPISACLCRRKYLTYPVPCLALFAILISTLPLGSIQIGSFVTCSPNH